MTLLMVGQLLWSRQFSAALLCCIFFFTSLLSPDRGFVFLFFSVVFFFPCCCFFHAIFFLFCILVYPRSLLLSVWGLPLEACGPSSIACTTVLHLSCDNHALEPLIVIFPISLRSWVLAVR